MIYCIKIYIVTNILILLIFKIIKSNQFHNFNRIRSILKNLTLSDMIGKNYFFLFV